MTRTSWLLWKLKKTRDLYKELYSGLYSPKGLHMLFYSVVPDTESVYIKYKVHDIRFPSLRNATVFGVISCLLLRRRWSVTNYKLTQRIKFQYETYLYLCKLLLNWYSIKRRGVQKTVTPLKFANSLRECNTPLTRSLPHLSDAGLAFSRLSFQNSQPWTTLWWERKAALHITVVWLLEKNPWDF